MNSQRVDRLEKALAGIASCATKCTCCEMHRQIALDALALNVVPAETTAKPPTCAHGYTICKPCRFPT